MTSLTLPPGMDMEQAAEILGNELPTLLNWAVVISGRPVRIIWNWSGDSIGSTNCVGTIWLNPIFFLIGQHEVGFGVDCHEAGHNRFSHNGTQLLERAFKRGGELLQHIVNLRMDRKDDICTAEMFSGFAETLWSRLGYLLTMSRREQIKDQLVGKDEKEIRKLLKQIKPADPYEDFLWAAKWHRRPTFKVTYKAMRHMRRRRLLNVSDDEHLARAEKIIEILGEPLPPDEKQKAKQRFLQLILIISQAEGKGKPLPPELEKLLQKLLSNYVGHARTNSLRNLSNHLKGQMVIHPGPMSVGMVNTITIHEVPHDPRNAPKNQLIQGKIEQHVNRLVADLHQLDVPEEFILYGQDEGDDLDLDEVAAIAAGLGGYYQETVEVRDLDAEIWLAVDTSASMMGDKIAGARRIGILFQRAMEVLNPHVIGRLWTYDTSGLYDYGAPGPNNAFVTLESHGSNSDSHMLQVAAQRLSRSQRKRKVLIMICDDGPDSIEKVRELSHQMLVRGIIPIHIMIGVHAVPDIYPFEILYSSLSEFIREFGELLKTVVFNLH